MNEENKILDEDIEETEEVEGIDVTDALEVPVPVDPKDDLLPDEIDSVPLEKSSVMIVNNIIQTDDIDDLKRLTKLFEINQAKKNALRVVKLNNLLDKVNDQAIERFNKRPYEVSNKELLDYMQVVQGQIEKSQKSIDKITESPMIQINQQNNSINVNVGDDAIDRDSKDRVIDAVKSLLKALKEKDEAAQVEPDIIPPQEVDINNTETEMKGDDEDVR